MKRKIFSQKFTNEYFLFLLPLFFVLHEFASYYPVVPIGVPIRLLVEYLLATIVLTIVAILVYKSFQKAALFAFLLFCIYFFFGAFHDALKNALGNVFITKYTILLPLLFIKLIVLALFFKKTNRTFSTLTKYLNILFILLILVDAGVLISKTSSKESLTVNLTREKIVRCASCTHPDIFLIVADEYAGKQELQEVFGFDNSVFLNELKSRGFHVVENSRSNYNATVYSMASMFNMNYLENFKNNRITLRDMFRCRELINDNAVSNFLKNSGYSIHNYSFFKVAGEENAVKNLFFPTHRDLFTSQTFINRMMHDIAFNFASKATLERIRKNNLYNDKIIDSLTIKTILEKTKTPKFVYSHFTMPHHPYFLDSNGKEAAYELLTDSYSSNKNAYVEYLVYTNKQLLKIVDLIKAHAERGFIIMIMSDHGWRQFDEDANKDYHFMNLNAVFLPNQDYSHYYNGMSNVNQFRVLMNIYFQQNFPMLKDSTKYLFE